MKVNEYLCKPYARRLTPDESGGFVATIQEFPGCIAEGDTADEALHNVDRAAASWIEVALSLGQEIPEPLFYRGYSGKIALRIPRGLHKQAAEMADSEGVSLNQFLVSAIARYLGERGASNNLIQEFKAEIRKALTVRDDDLLSYWSATGTSLKSAGVATMTHVSSASPKAIEVMAASSANVFKIMSGSVVSKMGK